MALSGGTRLGPYEILAAIGSGGMGEVYKARDTRLDRTVAIKILPPDVSADRDRCARFEREAKALAWLERLTGNQVKGIRHFENAVADSPDDSESLLLLSLSYAEFAGRAAAGAAAAERLIAIDPLTINNFYPLLAHIDPFFEPLRRELRFQRLLDRIKPEWEQFVPRFGPGSWDPVTPA